MTAEQATLQSVAHAAYRLGLIDTLLRAVEDSHIELAGIFVAQLEGERTYRLAVLEAHNVTIDGRLAKETV